MPDLLPLPLLLASFSEMPPPVTGKFCVLFTVSRSSTLSRILPFLMTKPDVKCWKRQQAPIMYVQLLYIREACMNRGSRGCDPVSAWKSCTGHCSFFTPLEVCSRRLEISWGYVRKKNCEFRSLEWLGKSGGWLKCTSMSTGSRELKRVVWDRVRTVRTYVLTMGQMLSFLFLLVFSLLPTKEKKIDAGTKDSFARLQLKSERPPPLFRSVAYGLTDFA